MPRWLLWTFVAVFSWGLWAILSKLIGDALSPAMSQALSTLGMLPIMAAMAPMALSKGPAENAGRPGRRRGILYALAAGVLSGIGNIAYYHALNSGGKAAAVIPLTALYPVVTVGLSVVILGERLNAVQTAGIGLSLAAIYLLNPLEAAPGGQSLAGGEGLASSWFAYALVPIALWGATGFVQKVSTRHASGEAATFWFHAAFVPVAGAILCLEPWPGAIAARTWALVIALGLTFALGNYGLLAAFASRGKAAVITPLSGLYPLVSVSAAVFFLGEKVSNSVLAGMGLALASVLAVSLEGSGKKQSTTQGPSRAREGNLPP